jgi:hypothetical protein
MMYCKAVIPVFTGRLWGVITCLPHSGRAGLHGKAPKKTAQSQRLLTQAMKFFYHPAHISHDCSIVRKFQYFHDKNGFPYTRGRQKKRLSGSSLICVSNLDPGKQGDGV